MPREVFWFHSFFSTRPNPLPSFTTDEPSWDEDTKEHFLELSIQYRWKRWGLATGITSSWRQYFVEGFQRNDASKVCWEFPIIFLISAHSFHNTPAWLCVGDFNCCFRQHSVLITIKYVHTIHIILVCMVSYDTYLSLANGILFYLCTWYYLMYIP